MFCCVLVGLLRAPNKAKPLESERNMPYLKHVVPPHKCILPDVREADLGSVWLCSDCCKIYEMVGLTADCRVWSEHHSLTITEQ